MQWSKRAVDIWTDFNIPGDPLSGAHKPVKSEIRAHLTQVENALDALDASSSRIISTSAPSGIPLDGQEWIVVSA